MRSIYRIQNICLALSVVLLIPTSIFANDALTEKLNGLLEKNAVAEKANIGILVIDVETGEEEYNLNADRLFTPASNAKIYTSAAALDIFGRDHRFETWIGIDGKITDGRLDGNLYLIGRGDPVMRTADLRSIATSVREYGIREVMGDLVIDVSLFEDVLKGPGWMWDDNPSEYSMSISPLMLNYNVVTAMITKSDSGVLRPSLEPASSYPPFTWVEGSTGDFRITREPFRSEITISGTTVPEGSNSVTKSLAVYDPPLWIGYTFLGMLQSNEVSFVGGYQSTDSSKGITSGVRLGVSPENAEVIVRNQSKPMSEILALFNKPSENAIGEMLWHHLALENGSYPASWSGGKKAMNKWLTESVGLAEGSLRLEDGSGLTRYNLITPRTTVAVLKAMWNSPDRQTYMDSLPVIGVDGTLGSRGNIAGTKGNVIAKTGSMSGVSTLSGYIENSDGEWKIFSILVNGYIGSTSPARKLQDQICAEIVLLPVETVTGATN